MGSFDRLHVQVHDAGLRIRPHGSVPGVGQRAGLPIAETADIVFIAAEVLAFSCPGSCGISTCVNSSDEILFFACGEFDEHSLGLHSLELVGAELLVDNLPDNLVGRHDI